MVFFRATPGPKRMVAKGRVSLFEDSSRASKESGFRDCYYYYYYHYRCVCEFEALSHKNWPESTSELEACEGCIYGLQQATNWTVPLSAKWSHGKNSHEGYDGTVCQLLIFHGSSMQQ